MSFDNLLTKSRHAENTIKRALMENDLFEVLVILLRKASSARIAAALRNPAAACCLLVFGTLGAASWLAEPKPLFGGDSALASKGANPDAEPAPAPVPSAADLGVEFVENSSSSLIVERDGRRYLVDLATHTIHEANAGGAASMPGAATKESTRSQGPSGGVAVFAKNCAGCHGPDGKGISGLKTPDFTSPEVQASLSDQQIEDTIRHGKKDTMMPAWEGKLSDGDVQSVRGFLRSLGSTNAAAGSQTAKSQKRKVYTPGDDLLFSLPTGRPVPEHSLTVNFTHRFPYTPAFSGEAGGGSLAGLDDFSLSSFGLRYGVTDKLSVSIYRSPTFIARPIQFMAAYNFLDEHHGAPINAAVRLSMQGENNFSRNYTENLEGIFSRSLGSRAQLYAVPTFSLNNRILFQPGSFLSSAIPNLPGHNTFSLGAGGAFDIRPTVALVAEVIPTLVNGRPLDIHRPAYSFGIQKKIWRHSFTFGFTTSPGTTVAQRAGTRASYLDDPEADKPSGLTVGFDLSRQIF
jgi:mono/diheme cytochrome c family protein